MDALEWIKNHTQHTETGEEGDCKWETSVFTGRLNPKMRSGVFAAFQKLEKYSISGCTRIYGELKLSMQHDVKSGETTLIFTEVMQ